MYHRRLQQTTTLLSAVALALLAACTDSPTAPTAVPPASPAVLANDFVDIRAQFGWLPAITPVTSRKGDSIVQKFTLNPKSGGLVSFGPGHVLVVYPWSICDPKTSGYGLGTWLLNCVQATSPISFTVTSYTTETGQPGATFKPDVRFVPGALVRLYFHDAAIKAFGKVTIPWCDEAGNCVDEGKKDDWQKTYYAPGNPGFWIYRNLRHFSSYIVAY